MKKNIIFTVIFFSIFFAPLSETAAQITEEPSKPLVTFDMTDFPQWAKDFRRFDIIAFGSFPFSMFFVNFFYDFYRWNKANGMDFSSAGRAYAPWPFKSAGAVEKTAFEFRSTIIMAASLSIVFAAVDLYIHKSKQKKELERIQNIPPSGSVNIIRSQDVTDEAEEHPPDKPEDTPSDGYLE
jgi:hypothetical protein